MNKEDILKRMDEIDAQLIAGHTEYAKTALDILRSEILSSIESSPTLDAKAVAYQRDIILSEDPVPAYEFAARVPGADIQALQHIVLKRGSSQDMYNFAKDVSGADIQALQSGIIENGDGWMAYCFAKNIEGADVNKLQDVVSCTEDVDMAYNFARFVTGADVESLQRITMEYGNGWDILAFAEHVKGANLLAIEERLNELGSQELHPNYLTLFNTRDGIQKRLKEQKKDAAMHNITARPKRI